MSCYSTNEEIQPAAAMECVNLKVNKGCHARKLKLKLGKQKSFDACMAAFSDATRATAFADLTANGTQTLWQDCSELTEKEGSN